MVKQLADKYIPASNGSKVLKKKGDTQDIIAEVISAFKDSRGQLNQFAPHLKADTLRQTLYNVWKFWKFNIRYQVDPEGVQWVQEPKALWARKEGDCKSLSVAVMCTLYELGIKASFRFTCYNPAIDFPTHVYVVVVNNGEEIPVDCVWKEFGTQKPYQQKWDYNMTAIYRLSGINDNVGRLSKKRKKQLATELFLPGSTILKKVLKNSKATDFLIPGSRIFRKLFSKKKKRRAVRGVLEIPANATHEVVGLLLDKQYLEMQQIQSAKIHGIGSTQDRAYEMEITAHHNAVAELMGTGQRHCVGYGEPVHPQDMIEGIAGRKKKAAGGGGGKGKAKRQTRKLNKAIKKNSGKKGVSKRQAKLLEKAGYTVNKRKEGLLKRVGKGLKKIVKAPARLAIRAKLPKAAPFFLYTFITDERVLSKLPEQVAIKRQKALYYKNIIVNKLEMPEQNFDKAVRNGIMNAFAKSPEEVLAKWMKDANFQIGILPIITAAFGVLKGLLKLLVGNAAKNLQEDMEKYAPQPEDWGAIPGEVKEEMSNGVRNQASNTDPAYNPPTENQFFNNNGGNEYDNMPGGPNPGYGGGDEESGGGGSYSSYGGGNSSGDDGAGDDAGGNGSGADSSGGAGSGITLSKRSGDSSAIVPGDGDTPPPAKSNTGLILGLTALGLAAVAMSGKKKGKKRA